MNKEKEERHELYQKISGILVIFALICYLTSWFLEFSHDKNITAIIPVQGGEVGPIEVKEDYTVYRIDVKQKLHKPGVWSFVSGEVLDAEKN